MLLLAGKSTSPSLIIIKGLAEIFEEWLLTAGLF